MVASKNGDLRFYKEIGENKNAINLYPGLGDNIRFLDTSKDGKWVLATCSTYLILLPT